MIPRPIRNAAVRAERPAQAVVFARTSRTTSRLIAFALAGLACIAMLAPAAASGPRSPGRIAPKAARSAACEGAAGCTDGNRRIAHRDDGTFSACIGSHCWLCNETRCVHVTLSKGAAKNRP
jgi:hypothetical protein